MSERKAKNSDGAIWKCSKRSCHTKRSIRTGSFFSGSHLLLKEQLLFIHIWSKDYPARIISGDFSFSPPTVVDWCRFYRDLSLWYIESIYESIQIEGPGHVVEIDETLIVRRKYNRGRVLAEEWLFGGVERRSDGKWEVFLEFVENKSSDVLYEIINRRIAKRTTIVSDGWAAGNNALLVTPPVTNYKKN
jgi:hypothetical protein